MPGVNPVISGQGSLKSPKLLRKKEVKIQVENGEEFF
jgi:hypothetical protein